jgi:RimJ/RimL family protein N-acetyltransferase
MSSQTISTLTTKRLILRPPIVDDFPAYARLHASPRAKYMGGPFVQRAEHDVRLEKLAFIEAQDHVLAEAGPVP